MRNSGVRTLFAVVVNQGPRLSRGLWEQCLWEMLFPLLNHAYLMSATASRDEVRRAAAAAGLVGPHCCACVAAARRLPGAVCSACCCCKGCLERAPAGGALSAAAHTGLPRPDPHARRQAQAMLLGQSRGREVRAMVHHSRNTEQKQWDESVVIALGGMARLLRAHLPAIVGMERVAGGRCRARLAAGLRGSWGGCCGARAPGPLPVLLCVQHACKRRRACSCAACCCRVVEHARLSDLSRCPPCLPSLPPPTAGWEEMMVVVESSMAGGRKEVALAAIALLSAVLQAHGSMCVGVGAGQQPGRLCRGGWTARVLLWQPAAAPPAPPSHPPLSALPVCAPPAAPTS